MNFEKSPNSSPNSPESPDLSNSSNSLESFGPHESDHELRPKYATRTVLFDADDKVAIIHVKNHGYYKIPGGGIEDGEDISTAAQREVREEAGCDCEITDKLGRLETEIPVWDMLDISDGFIATVSGPKSTPIYEPWEKERGFAVVWFDSLDQAIATIEANVVAEPGMENLQTRDLTFLKLARAALDRTEP